MTEDIRTLLTVARGHVARVRESSPALADRSYHDLTEASRNIAAALSALEAEGGTVRDAIADVISHQGDWRKALTAMRDAAAPPTHDQDDRSYWEKQLTVLDRILSALEGGNHAE